MGKLILCIIPLVLSYPAISQESFKNINNETIAVNSIYLELFGNGLLYSVNYDRIIPTSNRRMMALRLGFAYFPKSESMNNSNNAISIPFEVIFLKELKKHYLEFGMGITLALQNNDYQGYYKLVFLVPRFGYRYQHPDGEILLRFGFTPIIPLLVFDPIFGIESKPDFDPSFLPWGGISLGYAF
jgi:hypothetical protein